MNFYKAKALVNIIDYWILTIK